jgi:hypothetical protein
MQSPSSSHPSSFEGIRLGVASNSFLAEVQPVLEEVVTFISGDHPGPYAGQWDEVVAIIKESSIVRWDKNLWQTQQRLIGHTAGLILQESPNDGSGDEDRVQTLLTKHLDTGVPGEGLPYLPFGVMAALEVNRSLRGFADKVINPLNTGKPEDEFELMKLVARPALGPNPMSSELVARALQFVYFYNLLDGKRVAPSLALDTKLEAGEFDGFIARDMLRGVAETTEDHLQKNGIAALQKLLRLATRLTGQAEPSDDVIARLTDKDSLQSWPAECQRALDIRKEQYLRSLKEARTRVTLRINEENCLVPSNTTEANIDRFAAELIRAFAVRKSNDTAFRPQERLIAQRIATSMAKRRRLRAQAASESGSLMTSATIQEVSEREPRKLTYILPNGEMSPEGSPEYEALLNDFVDRHKGQAGLRDTLDGIVSFLKSLNLAVPQRGIFKLDGATDIHRGQTVMPKVYEMRPFDVVGLRMNTMRSTALRVMFTVIDGNVAIIGLDEKPKIDALLRNIGIKGKHRTRQ